MNLLHNIMLSDFLETPPGISSVFSLMPSEHGFRWERDYAKTNMDEGWEECVETHSQFLNSMAYEVYALCEIVRYSPIHPSHWQFTFN